MNEEEINKNSIFKLEEICLFSFLLLCFSTYKIFLSTRSFPLCPVFEWLPSLPTSLNLLIAIVIVCLITFNKYFTKRHLLYLSIMISMSLLILFDVNRLSPFIHTYTCFFFVFALYHLKVLNYKTTILLCQLILVGIYIATGVHKINPYFIENIFKWWLAPFKELMSESAYNIFLSTGWLVGYIEVAAGLFLLFTKTRKLGLWLAVVTHVIILISYSPPVRGLMFVGLIIYNISLIWIVIFLFKNEKSNLVTNLIGTQKKTISYLLTFVFIGVPVLHVFTDAIPTYMAYDLYGGRYRYTYFTFDEHIKNKLPTEYQLYCSKAENGKFKLFMEDWIFYDCRAGIFRQDWVFKRYKKEIEKFASNPSEVQMVVNKENQEEVIL